ncbi:MAG: carbonic anhydrase, partial [Chthoniobacteraceae bacterium]|nr:carbonic anhydrase [Chthoniobacteraceae bacterium]
NQRYSSGHAIHPDQSFSRRAEVARTQHPFAVILDCSDSRLSPEIIFDQGLGDLFVVRVAGNVIDDHALGSIEYAVEHLGASVVMVLGHQRCGAVKATVDAGAVEGHIKSIVKSIQPAVNKVKGQAGDSVDNAVRENAREVAEQLRKSKPVVAHWIHEKHGKVVPAYYSLDSGKVISLD